MKKLILIFSALFLTLGCASGKHALKSPEELYAEGIECFQGEGAWILPDIPNYPLAVEKFQELIDNYPYSRFATMAKLKIAEAHHREKEYDEAVEVYTEFVNLHPAHPDVPYAMYQTGMVYFEQLEKIDRDQTATRKALEQFNLLVGTHPDCQYVGDAKKKISELRRKLAMHEFYVGKFYIKMKEFEAALGRFRVIKRDYPEMEFIPEVDELIKEVEERIRDSSELGVGSSE